ncbi:MAG: hypothetical protein ACJ790_07885 [Myxococcaceae bacterium]
MSALRPLQVGEIVDRSVTWWRRRLWPLFQLALGFQIAGYAAGKAYEFALTRWAPLLNDPAQLQVLVKRGFTPDQIRQVAIAGVATFLWAAFVVALSWIANVLVSAYAIGELTGAPITPGAAAKRLLNRTGALFSVLILGHAWAFLAYLGAMLPGALLLGVFSLLLEKVPIASFGALVLAMAAFGFGSLFIFLWYILRFMLAPAVVATEAGGGLHAFRRSRELISGRMGPRFGDRQFIRATLVLTVMVVVVLVVGLVTSLPALIVQTAFGGFGGAGADPTRVPQLLLIPAELFEVFCASLLVPLTYVLSAVFYLDARMRREGLDLELTLDELQRRIAA